MNEEIAVINKRLSELNKEFADLAALKKKLKRQNTLDSIKDKYGDYNFLVKSKVNEVIDFDKLINEGNINFGKSSYGLTCVQYDLGNGKRSYHIATTEDEAAKIRIVEALGNVENRLDSLIEKNKEITADDILNLYDGARNGQQLQESADTEEVSQ